MTLKVLLLSIPAFSVYSCMAFDMLFTVTENYPPNYSSAFTVNEYFIGAIMGNGRTSINHHAEWGYE